MQEGVIVTDLNNVIVDFNPAAVGFLKGLTVNSIGKKLFGQFPEFQRVHNAMIIKENNDIQYYEIRQVPILMRKGNEIGIAWYLRQITDQHNLLIKLKNYAEKDELTGIWNRREWIEMAENAITDAIKDKKQLAIMFRGIDHFKLINDTLGHEAGDKALINMTEIIKRELRTKDLFGRIGGEEFAVIYKDTNIDTILALSEQILKAIENNKFFYENKEVTITISAGIAYCEKCIDISFKEFMRKADFALYEAKNNGRNKAVFTKM